MSKELTEQWRNGTLENGFYYVKIYNDVVVTSEYFKDIDDEYFYNLNYDEVVEVLAPVPTYDQFSQMVKKVERLEQLLESETLAKQEGVEIVAELEYRLKEAENVIKFYADAQPLTEEERQMTAEKYHLVYGLKACDYLEKYKVEEK